MDPSLRTQVDTQAEEQEHLSDAQSGTCIISDVSSTIFPAYSSRESVGPDHPPTCTGQTRTGVALDQPCFNYIRGLILVIEFGQNENLIYEHIALAELPDSVPGKFHCMECFLYFNSKTELLVHLLKSGRDLCEDTSKHIVCPVCFVEFIGTERVEHLETHVARKHKWELQLVMHGMSLPDMGQYQFEEESTGSDGDQSFPGVRLDQEYREERW